MAKKYNLSLYEKHGNHIEYRGNNEDGNILRTIKAVLRNDGNIIKIIFEDIALFSEEDNFTVGEFEQDVIKKYSLVKVSN